MCGGIVQTTDEPNTSNAHGAMLPICYRSCTDILLDQERKKR